MRKSVCVTVFLCFIVAGLKPCATLSHSAQRTTGPVIWLNFETENNNVMQLDGQGGLVIDADRNLDLSRGFTLDFWVKFNDVSSCYSIASKEEEFLLRIDSPNEGGRISFFVNSGGALDPRVTGIVPEVDRWYHIVAGWDGKNNFLWIGDKFFTGKKPGQLKSTSNPVLVGKGSKWAPTGIIGLMDEFKIYNRCLTDGEILLSNYRLDVTVTGKRTTEPVLEFSKGMGNWKTGDNSIIYNPLLDIPVEGREFAVIKMSATSGKTAKLLFSTTEGANIVGFPIKSDGKIRTYSVQLDNFKEWSGNLRLLCLIPSERETRIQLNSVRIAGNKDAPPQITIKYFFSDIVDRAIRPVKILATLVNDGGTGKNLSAKLNVPPGVKVLGNDVNKIDIIENGESIDLTWTIQAESPREAKLALSVTGIDVDEAVSECNVSFTPPVALTKAEYVPEPQPAKTDYLIGAANCPLWYNTHFWSTILDSPEIMPVLGFYDEANPEVKDWEIKWALEHGISFFVFCWYRSNLDASIKMNHDTGITNGILKSRYLGKFKFAIWWINSQYAGVSSEDDLVKNLLPFWIENYFKNPGYLKIDNKPVLFIFQMASLIKNLGGADNVRTAFDRMRDVCKQAGFDGLIIVGHYLFDDHRLLKETGVDYGSSYISRVTSRNPSPDVAIEEQEEYWNQIQQKVNSQSGMPGQIITCSQGWTGWGSEGNPYKIPPDGYKKLLKRAKEFMSTLPANQFGSKMLILDNWNEWGEGHYIAPHREYGFGYLDAVREVFSSSPKEHVDVIPQDVGLGPYDVFSKELMVESASDTCWTGEKLKKWDGMTGLTDIILKNGILYAVADSGDPAFGSPVMKLKTNIYSKVIVEMRTDRQGTAQLFWKTDRFPQYDEEASIKLSLISDAEFHRYIFEVGKNNEWKGYLMGLRFDPATTSGTTIEIRSIKLE